MALGRSGTLTLQVTVEERNAACQVMNSYVCYLEANIPPMAERAIVIAKLHQLQLRLLPLSPAGDGFITANVPLDEAVVLGQAVLVYQEILRTRPELLPQDASERLRLVNGMQQRHLSQRQSLH